MAKDKIVKLNLRLPKQVHKVIKHIAAYNNHSINTEILCAIMVHGEAFVTRKERNLTVAEIEARIKTAS